ncbi:flavin reductase family protein [Congregibacter brevis]|uniref:Flavin reductase family protein n=1 Tax=Congregibacter brevis TaxID=3081201 RepID=A0ABZ0I8N6_9GAMM|nr:flavin reductase family protein [Congregibacter sp. IMCC45268]
MLLSSIDIEALERRRRAALINSITGFKPANLVGTVDKDGHTNLSIMSSLVHIGSNPPLLALIFRPDNTERHTLDNIRQTGSYTVNHVNGSIVDAAHQTAARYPRQVSEFAATGLREHWQDGVAAPFVAEASVRMGMKLREEIPIEINGTHMVIGEIVWLEAPDIAINDAGALDPALADSISISGLDSYYRSDLLQRMAYAKPDKAPERLDS